MKPFIFSALYAVLLAGTAAMPAHAQMAISDTPEPAFEARLSGEEIEFETLEAVPDDGAALINGVLADPNVFPGVLRMTTGGTCTASLIGPATIYLAAHCVGHGDFIRFRAGGGAVRGVCDQAPGYRLGEASHDWALCLLSRRVSGIKFETVNLGTPVGLNTDVLLTGYGCTEEDGKSDKRLRIGAARTAARPNGLPVEASTIYTFGDIDSGGAVLCPGDSGGPIFRLFDGTPDGRRIIEGVNSRTTYSFGFSLFSASASSSGSDFIRTWAEANGQTICGLNLSGNDCQGG